MRTEYEEYLETRMLGRYDPHRAMLRETENEEVLTCFCDTCYQHQDDHNVNQKYSRSAGQSVRIVYRDIGRVDSTM